MLFRGGLKQHAGRGAPLQHQRCGSSRKELEAADLVCELNHGREAETSLAAQCDSVALTSAATPEKVNGWYFGPYSLGFAASGSEFRV